MVSVWNAPIMRRPPCSNEGSEDRRLRWGGWTSNPVGVASDPGQVRLLWSSAKLLPSQSVSISLLIKKVTVAIAGSGNSLRKCILFWTEFCSAQRSISCSEGNTGDENTEAAMRLLASYTHFKPLPFRGDIINPLSWTYCNHNKNLKKISCTENFILKGYGNLLLFPWFWAAVLLLKLRPSHYL